MSRWLCWREAVKALAPLAEVNQAHAPVPFVEPCGGDAERGGNTEARVEEGATGAMHDPLDGGAVEAGTPRERGDGERITGFVIPKDKCEEGVTFERERRRSIVSTPRDWYQGKPRS